MPDPIALIVGAVVTFFITFCLNKFLSIFRYRQLYATLYDDLEDVYGGGKIGRSLTVVIGNKGKDKEESIELVFLEAVFVEIVSSDSLGAKVSGNSIKIDRLVKDEKVKLCVFMEGAQKKYTTKTVKLRSADAAGGLYFKYGSEPVGLGPIFFNISVITVFAGWFVYAVNTGLGPDHLYNKLRYWDFYQSGFEITTFSNSRLVSDLYPNSQNHPIKYIEARGEGNKVFLIFEIENTTSVMMKVFTSTLIDNAEYEQKSTSALTIFDKEESTKVWRQLREDYGVRYDGLDDKEIIVPPQGKAKLVVIRSHGAKTKGIDFKAKFTISFEGDERFSDRDEYLFNPNVAGVKDSDIIWGD